MKILETSTRSNRCRLALLAPGSPHISQGFRRVETDPLAHSDLLSQVQRLRGSVYLEDGAIRQGQLDLLGRHRQAADRQSWHVVSMQDNGRVTGCIRFQPHSPASTFNDLGVSRSSLAHSRQWGSALRRAVESEMSEARRNQTVFVEVGGWALDPDVRHTCEGLRLVLALFGLARLLGGAAGVTTATARHHSSSILRRIGGRPLQHDGAELPPYYDPQYGCMMEALRFDSGSLSSRYLGWIGEVASHLSDTHVICQGPAIERLRTIPAVHSLPVEDFPRLEPGLAVA